MMMKQQDWKWVEQLDIFSTTTLELEEDDEAGIFSITDASKGSFFLKTYAFKALGCIPIHLDPFSSLIRSPFTHY